MLIWLQGLMLMHMLMLMLIWLQGGKLVWSDGSPADFSVWLEGGLNYKVFLHLSVKLVWISYMPSFFALIIIMVWRFRPPSAFLGLHCCLCNRHLSSEKVSRDQLFQKKTDITASSSGDKLPYRDRWRKRGRNGRLLCLPNQNPSPRLTLTQHTTWFPTHRPRHVKVFWSIIYMESKTVLSNYLYGK